MNDTPVPVEVSGLTIAPDRPLVIIDVDEVLGQFMRGFEQYIETQGLEMRIDRFALFQNIYRPGDVQPIDMVEGKRLFDGYFALDPQMMDVSPGAPEALAALASHATIVIFTNAPAHARVARGRWLEDNALCYPLLIGSGPKGPAVAAMASRTAGPVAFIDDLLPNLDSVAREAPGVHRFQFVADARLRPLAPTAPDRHRRHDHWPDLTEAIFETLGLPTR